ncbi:PKD-like family lipoprotein [Niabella yanshanensis]|uniref:PKD-like family lipoprotein n=1 Tax=Niabella yanshanensis TaxID=577386 RepID=A0ABZ0W8T5_9BACT|nr:PKD-like family lipoprotein [Niabella yanshanensis]WQD38954.1 PKD-like family lipoprotein [Niabella yanshanensis]
MKADFIKYIQIAILMAATALTGCYKDKGNYDYKDINEIRVTDINAAQRIYVNPDDTLRLNPSIVQSQPSDDLSYAWFMYNNSPNSSYVMPRDTIARTPNLAFRVTGDLFVLGENYRVTLKVTDNKTGISAVRQYDITVANKYAQGWMFLEEKPTGADLSMILPDNSVEHNIYSLLNPTAALGKPKSITATNFDVTDDLSTPNRRIYIQTENDAIELSSLTLTKKFDIGYLFFTRPQTVKPSFIGWAAYMSGSNPWQRMGIAINNGQVHTNMVGGFPGIKKWGEAIVNPAGVYDYDIAPYLAGGSTYAATYQVIVYDKKYRRFYSVGMNALTAFPSAASTVFNMNDVGMDLLLLDSANVLDRYNAVMKDGETPYLLQFRTVVSADDPVVTIAKTAMNAPGIVNAAALASSTLTPHIFYAVGNKLFKYETTSNITTEAFNLPAAETVTRIDYVRAASGTGLQRLVVATWNGTEGKVYYFNISPVGDLGSNYTHVFNGFKKIIDFVYKY